MFQRTVSLWRRLIRSAPESNGSPQVVEERRQSIRYRSEEPVRYRPAEATETEAYLTAQLQNVSAGGISLLTDQEFQPGALLSVQVPATANDRPTAVLACVVHVNARPEQRWAVGCTFASELSPEDLVAFGAVPASNRLAPDQRSQPRRACAIEGTYQLVAEEVDATWPARVLNLSTTGVGLAINQPIPVGKLLSIELQAAGATQSRQLLCCAVHVTDVSATEWVVGCNFITELQESDVNALLGA